MYVAYVSVEFALGAYGPRLPTPVIAVAFAGHSRVEMASTIYSTMLLMKA